MSPRIGSADIREEQMERNLVAHGSVDYPGGPVEQWKLAPWKPPKLSPEDERYVTKVLLEWRTEVALRNQRRGDEASGQTVLSEPAVDLARADLDAMSDVSREVPRESTGLSTGEWPDAREFPDWEG